MKINEFFIVLIKWYVVGLSCLGFVYLYWKLKEAHDQKNWDKQVKSFVQYVEEESRKNDTI